jgi:hypothetical protein
MSAKKRDPRAGGFTKRRILLATMFAAGELIFFLVTRNLAVILLTIPFALSAGFWFPQVKKFDDEDDRYGGGRDQELPW